VKYSTIAISIPMKTNNRTLFPNRLGEKLLEAISKIGSWFKIKAGRHFNPQEYFSILRS
jgi:hypothetical protein